MVVVLFSRVCCLFSLYLVKLVYYHALFIFPLLYYVIAVSEPLLVLFTGLLSVVPVFIVFLYVYDMYGREAFLCNNYWNWNSAIVLCLVECSTVLCRLFVCTFYMYLLLVGLFLFVFSIGFLWMLLALLSLIYGCVFHIFNTPACCCRSNLLQYMLNSNIPLNVVVH